jgi:hypothetical protein
VSREVTEAQQQVCQRFGVEPYPAPSDLKVGVSRSVREGEIPLHGLRHPPEGDTTGWYIWAGPFSDDPDFFVPLHVEHLAEWRPEVLDYLALPPGWRFLLAPDYEDVWEDESLRLAPEEWKKRPQPVDWFRAMRRSRESH